MRGSVNMRLLMMARIMNWKTKLFWSRALIAHVRLSIPIMAMIFPLWFMSLTFNIASSLLIELLTDIVVMLCLIIVTNFVLLLINLIILRLQLMRMKVILISCDHNMIVMVSIMVLPNIARHLLQQNSIRFLYKKALSPIWWYDDAWWCKLTVKKYNFNHSWQLEMHGQVLPSWKYWEHFFNVQADKLSHSWIQSIDPDSYRLESYCHQINFKYSAGLLWAYMLTMDCCRGFLYNKNKGIFDNIAGSTLWSALSRSQLLASIQIQFVYKPKQSCLAKVYIIGLDLKWLALVPTAFFHSIMPPSCLFWSQFLTI